MVEFETARLILRQWRDEDYVFFAQMNADLQVMQYFPACLNREKSDEAAEHYRKLIASCGRGFWAVEFKE